MRVVAGVVLLTAALVPLAPAPAAEPTAREVLDAIETQLRTVSATAGPSVACVVVSRSDLYPRPAADDPPGRLGGFDPNSVARPDLARRLDLSDRRLIPDHGCAGGVVIDPAGLVLTNYHVIDGATKVYVHLPGGKGSYADIHAADARSDLAVLKLITPPAGLEPIKFGEVRTHDGARKATVFIGKLVGVLAHSYVSGFVAERPNVALASLANVRKRLQIPDPSGVKSSSIYNYGTLLEYASLARPDKTPYPWCSGAAVVNLDGELIGLTTTAAVVSSPETGPGFAIPIDAGTRGVIDVLRRGEEVEYGFLGVVIDQRSGLVGTGVHLSDVSPGGPADTAGLRPRDVIIRINDQPTHNYDDLLQQIGAARAGGRVKVTVSSGGQPRDVEVTLAKFKNEAPYIATVRPEPVFGLRVDWSSVLAQTLGPVSRGALRPGVVVRSLVPESPAAVRFAALGENGTRWLITRVDGTPTPTPADFYKAAAGKPSVKLTVIDPNDPAATERTVTLP